MNHPKIWDAVRDHFYSRDYDSKTGKNANVLADEMMTTLQPFLDSMPMPVIPEPELWVTIGGVRYLLEEIKK